MQIATDKHWAQVRKQPLYRYKHVLAISVFTRVYAAQNKNPTALLVVIALVLVRLGRRIPPK